LNRSLVKNLAAVITFLALVVGSTYYLQHTLIVFRHFGSYAHWFVILLVIPLLVGIFLRQLQIPHAGAALFVGGVCSMPLAYFIFSYHWAQQPTRLAAFLFGFITAGVAYLAIIKWGKAFNAILNSFTIHKKTSPPETQKTTENALGRTEDQTKKPTHVKWSIKNTLSSSHYAGFIATVQLVIGLISLILSAISIFVLAN
jgi:hypothetical protein